MKYSASETVFAGQRPEKINQTKTFLKSLVTILLSMGVCATKFKFNSIKILSKKNMFFISRQETGRLSSIASRRKLCKGLDCMLFKHDIYIPALHLIEALCIYLWLVPLLHFALSQNVKSFLLEHHWIQSWTQKDLKWKQLFKHGNSIFSMGLN